MFEVSPNSSHTGAQRPRHCTIASSMTYSNQSGAAEVRISIVNVYILKYFGAKKLIPEFPDKRWNVRSFKRQKPVKEEVTCQWLNE